MAQALTEIRSSGVPLYIINLGPLIRSDLPPAASAQSIYARLDWENAQSELAALARASGGRMYSPEVQLDLTPIFDELTANLRTRYVLHYKARDTASPARARTVRFELVESDHSTPVKPAQHGTAGPHGRLVAQATYNPASETPR